MSIQLTVWIHSGPNPYQFCLKPGQTRRVARHDGISVQYDGEHVCILDSTKTQVYVVREDKPQTVLTHSLYLSFLATSKTSPPVTNSYAFLKPLIPIIACVGLLLHLTILRRESAFFKVVYEQAWEAVFNDMWNDHVDHRLVETVAIWPTPFPPEAKNLVRWMNTFSDWSENIRKDFEEHLKTAWLEHRLAQIFWIFQVQDQLYGDELDLHVFGLGATALPKSSTTIFNKLTAYERRIKWVLYLLAYANWLQEKQKALLSFY